jgi:hypothetical protein
MKFGVQRTRGPLRAMARNVGSFAASRGAS